MIKAGAKLLKKAKPKGMLKAKPKAGMVARRNMLRGKTEAEKYKGTLDPQKALRQQKKKPLIGKFEKGVGTGVAAALAYQEIKKGQKEAKAKEDKKLKKALEKKKAEDKKKKDAYGKRAPKKDKYYGGR